jgi:hypothetical protein
VKQVAVVTGMHRSGITCVAGVLHLMSYYLGRSSDGSFDENHVQAFENPTVLETNEAVLSGMHGTWLNPPEKLRGMNAPTYLVSRIKIMLQAEYRKEERVCIKDTRLCLLLDSYLEALQQLEWPVVVIRMERLKQEVEASLQVLKARCAQQDYGKLYDFYQERLDWIIQMRNPTVHTFNYTDLTKNPVVATKSIMTALGHKIDVDVNQKKLVEFIASQLERH